MALKKSCDTNSLYSACALKFDSQKERNIGRFKYTIWGLGAYTKRQIKSAALECKKKQ